MADNFVPRNTEKNPKWYSTRLSNEERKKRRLLHRTHKLSSGFTEYGYVVSDGEKVPPEYLIRVTSYRNNCTVISPFQEDGISMTVDSSWDPIIPTSILRRANIFVQATTQRSAITSSTTRRLWSGTSPMVILIKMKFEAVSDPFVEVVEPCRLLQLMALPSNPSGESGPDVSGVVEAAGELRFGDAVGKIKEAIANLPMLQPPGPSPFTWDSLLSGQVNYPDRTRSDIENARKGGDFIILELGTFLTFWNVIIREDLVNFKTKFGPDGLPISAEAEIRFETYEMPTKESLDYSYTQIVPSTGG